MRNVVRKLRYWLWYRRLSPTARYIHRHFGRMLRKMGET